MSFVTRPILCGGVGCGFEMRSQLPLALDSSAQTNTAKAGCLAQWLGDTVGPTEATTDSTSKVVDDSHAEDCKTWLFIDSQVLRIKAVAVIAIKIPARIVSLACSQYAHTGTHHSA